jgi:hypothetical protein
MQTHLRQLLQTDFAPLGGLRLLLTAKPHFNLQVSNGGRMKKVRKVMTSNSHKMRWHSHWPQNWHEGL